FDFFGNDLAAREVGHGKFVDKMGAAIGAVERYWRIGHREEKGRHFLRSSGLSSDKRQGEDQQKNRLPKVTSEHGGFSLSNRSDLSEDSPFMVTQNQWNQ